MPRITEGRRCQDCDYFDKDKPKLCYRGLYTYIERVDGTRTYARGCNTYRNEKREIYIRKMNYDRRTTESYRLRARGLGYDTE